MKRLYVLSVFTMVLGLVGLFGVDASAQLKGTKITNSGNAKATGGNGGNATGTGAKAGNGGSAAAKGGSIFPGKGTVVSNSGNADAKGGNGGNAKGKGAKGGNGGDATAVGGDIGTPPKKIIPIDPGKGNGKGKGNPKAGGGGGGTAKAGDATAKGGNGGDANGKGAKGGNGGDAIAVSGNNNTVINGDNNTVIGKVVNNNISLNIGGFGGGGFGGGFVTGGAFAQGGFGGDGFVPGTPGVAVASSPSETVITNDGSPAIAQGANGKSNVEEGEVEQVFTKRFLKVKNDSGMPMKVFVQYRGQDDNKKWAWLPADPNDSKDALVFDLAVGEETFLQHKGSKLSASRVRIWGVAAEQNWFDFRDQDLWVVPEMDQRGEHRYQATEMRTFTFVFPKKEAESK